MSAPASGAWNFACSDWEQRLADGRSLVPDLPLDPERSRKAVEVFNRLRLPDVPGQPEMRNAAGDWFRDIVRALWGSLDEEGARRVPEVFCMVPKKNSKTTGGSGIMVTALVVNKRPRAEFLLIGPTQEIADLAFAQAEGMIEADPYLSKRFHVAAHKKTITDRTNKAFLKIKTFDMKVMTGAKPSGVLLDELHIMSSISGAARVLGQVRGGLLPNPEGFLITITTQSDEPPKGVFKQELQYARKIRDGKADGRARVLPILYEFPESVQTDKKKPWLDPARWPQVLPNLGLSIDIERMQDGLAEAREKGEEELRRWASQHLNVEIGVALHSDRWRGADHWEAAGDPSLADLDELLARCEVAVVGADGGGLDDLFGLCVAGRDRDTGAWLYWLHAWCQRDVLTLRKEIAPKLEDLEKAGDLTICDQPTQDLEEITEIVGRVKATGLMPEQAAVGLDPQGIAALVDELAGIGVTEDQLVGIAQGFRLSSAVWGLERKLRDGTAYHGAQAIGAWCVGNAKAEQRGNAVLITKEAAGKAKIDPLCAAFNATKLLERNPAPPKPKAKAFVGFVA